MLLSNPRPTAASALLASLTLLALPRVATALPQETPASEPSQEDHSSSMRRILHLHSGSTVRAVTRLSEAGWEFRRSGSWQAIPRGAVARVELERVVLGEWKSSLRAARKEGLQARADLGAWSLESGLLEEGLGTLERVLEEHPDQPTALEALGVHGHRFAVPRVEPHAEDGARSTEELRSWSAGRGITSRELAVLELARVRDREGLERALLGDLIAGSFRRRTFAAQALRRLFPGHGVERLVQRAVLDSAGPVREQAAYALRDVGRVGVIVPVARALASSHPRVRIQAAEALGNMGYPAAVEPLVLRLSAAQKGSGRSAPHSHIFVGRQFAYIQDFDVEVASSQAAADPGVNVLVEGSVLDAAVLGVQQTSFVSEGRAIRGALVKLTGADPGSSNRAWLRWWEEHAEKWRTKDLAERAPGYPLGR